MSFDNAPLYSAWQPTMNTPDPSLDPLILRYYNEIYWRNNVSDLANASFSCPSWLTTDDAYDPHSMSLNTSPPRNQADFPPPPLTRGGHISGSFIPAARQRRRQVQKRRSLNRYSVVSPPPPSGPFGVPSQALQGFKKCSLESGSMHTSVFDDQMEASTSFTDAVAYRVKGVPLDPLSQQDPESHFHRQDYEEYSSFPPAQNGEQQMCSAVYDQDPFWTQSPGFLPSLQVLNQGQNPRNTGGPPAQHLSASSHVARLPGPPFPEVTQSDHHFQHYLHAEREMYEGVDGHYLHAGPHVEATNGWASPGDCAGDRVPSTDHSSERVALLSGEAIARTMAETAPFTAPGFYRQMQAKERDIESDVLHTPIPGSLFNRNRCDEIVRNSYSKLSERLSALPPGTNATEASALVVYPSTTHAELPPSACVTDTVSPQCLTIPESASAEFRREDIKIQHFPQTVSNSYAVQLQGDRIASKAWIVRICPTSSHRDGPLLCVRIYLDYNQPYRFPPKPPSGRQPPGHRLQCSEATLHARSLMDVLERLHTYKSYKEMCAILSPRDLMVLECALDRIANGDLPGAVTQPWKTFKAACQSWADSGRWEDSKYVGRRRYRRGQNVGIPKRPKRVASG